MLREHESYFSIVQIFLDCISILVAYAVCAPLSFFIIELTGNLFAPPEFVYFSRLQLPLFWDKYLHFLPLLVILPVSVQHFMNAYRHVGSSSVGSILKQTGYSCFISMVVSLVFLLVFSPLIKGNLLFLVLFFVLLWLLYAANRQLIVFLIHHAQQKGKFIQFTVIIGTDMTAQDTMRILDQRPEWGIRIVGCLTTDAGDVGETIAGYPVLDTVENLPVVLEKNIVDCVSFASGIENLSQLQNIAHFCETRGVDFSFAATVIGKQFENVSAEHLNDISLIFLQPVYRNPLKLFVKRCFDIVGSLFLISLCFPLWIIMPILIRRDSPGAAFFRQERVGRHGRIFTMYKFRSMVENATQIQNQLQELNEVDGPVFKIKHDPRLTKTGKFLRRTSLDEFPQLFNVLKGDMSLVGPRPPLFNEVLQYHPWERKRLAVMPGITCLWQVSGRSELNFDEWMNLDKQYLDSWSLTLDLKILLRTIPAVLSRKGAQ